LAHEIVEKNEGQPTWFGRIRRRGVAPAQRLAQIIERIERSPVPVGTLDITLYRTTFHSRSKPVVQKTDIGFPITGKNINSGG